MITITTTMDCQAMTAESYGASHGPEVLVKIPKGTVCQYEGHVPGGNIAVSINGAKLILHPASTRME